jgi:hypothetical protein
MIAPGTTPTVQSLDTVIRALVRLNSVDCLSWRKIASREEYLGIAAGTLCEIAKGREPKDAHVRAQLHLPALIPAPACVKCGEVHTTKACTKDRQPRKVWVRVFGHGQGVRI